MKFTFRPATMLAARTTLFSRFWLRAICPLVLLAALPISALAAQLTLTWQDNSDDELGFKVERSADGVNFSEIASVGPDVKTYADTSVTPGTKYTYRVAAYNAIGNSPYSNVATNAPSIATQPATQSVTAFQTVTFTVTGSGVPAPSFQWKKGGVDLANGVGASGVTVSGATTSTLTLTGVRVSDAGTYTVVASNGVTPDAVSDDAVLTVGKAAQTITLSFNAIVTYSPSGSYDPGATSSSGLPITYGSSNTGVAVASGSAVTIAGAGSTTITASQAGDANFLPATAANSQNLTINKATQTITFPAFPTVAVGSAPITLTATASSGLPITYLSLNTGVATISGNLLTVTATGLNFANIRASQDGDANYFAANFVEQRLDVQASGFPIFTTQPVNQTIAPAGTAVFTVVATGTPGPSLQWQVSTNGGVNWSNLTNVSPYSGVTTDTLTITAADPSLNGNQYRCVATNSVGAGTSDVAHLTVGIPSAPIFDTQPTNQSGTIGATVSFTAAASGIPTPTLQWQVSTDGGSNWTDLTNITPYSGTTTGTLTISSIALAQDGYKYRVVANNTQGTTNSNAATLTVNGIAPTIVTQPSARSALVGANVTFSSAIDGNPGPTLQWQLSTDSGVNWTDLANAGVYSGVNTTTLSLTNVTLSLNGNRYRIVATNTAGVATSNGASLTVSTTPPPPTGGAEILTQPVSQLATVGGSVTFSVLATGSPAPSYQWRRNGAPISGATNSTLTLNGLSLSDSGAVFDVIVSNSNGSATSDPAVLTVTNTTGPSAVFAGDLGSGGKYSLFVRADGQAVLIVSLPNGRGNFVVTFTVGSDGTFHTNASVASDRISAAAADLGTDGLAAPLSAGDSATLSLSGTISNGQLLGQIDGTGELFAGLAQMVAGGALNAGYYEAPALNGATGTAYIIVTPSGTVTGALSSGGVVQVGVGTLAADGKFTLQLGSNLAFDAALDSSSGSLSGRLIDNKGSPTGTFAGIASGVTPTDRLVNISARGSSGDNDQIIITGFIIGGTQPRTILLRAVGPSLSSFGVSGVMENPVLTLYDAARNSIASNDDWSTSANASLISSEGGRIGAFPLTAGSKDAALLVTLQPGLYTAQATRVANTTNGVALIEIYDATLTGSTSEKLVNISSRGQVRTGDGILIDGFIVSGNAPKKVLIRGVGPALAAYGLNNLLANPMLRLFQGNTMIASNDDWGTGDATTIATVSSQIGAFALTANSKDSVLLLTLLPGLYTAQLSGADGGSGIGLLEVYEVP